MSEREEVIKEIKNAQTVLMKLIATLANNIHEILPKDQMPIMLYDSEWAKKTQ